VNSSDERAQPRREFLGQVAASAMVLAGAGCATPAAASQVAAIPAGRPDPGRHASSALGASPSTQWDDSWFARLTAKHKAVFDSPQIEDGLVLANATGYIRGMRDALGAGDNDVQTVIVVRHAAIPMALSDAMWGKYEIGKDKKIRDEGSDGWATRNPYANGRGTASQDADHPVSSFAWLGSHGHVLLGCDLALRNYANSVARRVKADQTAVYEELKANLVPGVILQPTGVYAALRAQEAGCAYIRST
jgi:hypothetical protein